MCGRGYLFVLMVVVLGLTCCGDSTRPLSEADCAGAKRLAADFEGRVRMMQRALDEDLLLLGRYPEERFIPRLVARTHQLPLREAVNRAEENLDDLIVRMTAAGCNRR